ncbi:MAG: RNA polymerase subunit sigma [Verrucomicrobia bacterium]|nr:MAG: RNA polymerase subunit sigma [Verrucomicrobiota bacterium]
MSGKAQKFIPTRPSLLIRLKNWDDQQSWRDFHDTYWKLIYNTAIKSGLNHAEAEDVVQETIIAVSKQMPKFKYDPKIGSFKGWLLKTTGWKIRDYIRRIRTGEILAVDMPQQGDASNTGPIERMADPLSSDPEKIMDAAWAKELLDAARERVKRRVSPRNFQLYELHVHQDRPVSEVMEMLGVSRASVHLARCRVGRQIEKEVRRLEGMML